MNLKLNFKQEAKFAVQLELISKGVWKPICKIDMCVLEDNELAREVLETDSFEPVVYLRCTNLPDVEASLIQQFLASDQVTYCRLQSPSAVVTEGLHFKVLRIRELYRCSLPVERKDGKAANKRFFKYRWMITAIAADSDFDESHALKQRIILAQNRAATARQQGHKELAKEALKEKRKYQKLRDKLDEDQTTHDE
jgi:hypothetical protein